MREKYQSRADRRDFKAVWRKKKSKQPVLPAVFNCAKAKCVKNWSPIWKFEIYHDTNVAKKIR
jgi:hypothetical protein